MPETTITLLLPEGAFQAKVQIFGARERNELRDIYKEWRDLSNKLRAMNARAGNIPDGLSEGVFCLATGAVRLIGSIPGANSSFDCYDLSNDRRIQVKSASVIPDLTSFGPRSVWDDLYFLDFYRNGSWDGTVNIYHIPNSYIYGNKVNSTQSFVQQQEQGRRPRFSIYNDIIKKYRISPMMTYSLF
ncbi:MAG: Bsp6I family type II restriction endonuclease [Thermoplasmatales archaeon]